MLKRKERRRDELKAKLKTLQGFFKKKSTFFLCFVVNAGVRRLVAHADGRTEDNFKMQQREKGSGVLLKIRRHGDEPSGTTKDG